MKFLTMACLVFLAAGFWTCSRQAKNLAGSGSETPNAFTGKVYRPTGLNYAGPYQPVGDAEIILYRISETGNGYQWLTHTSLHSDVDGQFVVGSLVEGRYSILVQKDGLKDFAYFDYHLHSGSIVVDSVILKPTQKIEGILKDTAGAPYALAYLGLVGTPCFDTTAADGRFAFDSVPSGVIFPFQILSAGIKGSVLFNWSRAALDTSGSQYALLVKDADALVLSDSAGGCLTPEFGYTLPVESGLLAQDSLSPVNSLCGWETDTLSIKVVASTKTTTVVDGNFVIEYTVTQNP